MRKPVMTILFLFLTLIPLGKAQAIENFLTEHDITYQIDENGVASVTQNITLTNLKKEIIATNYAIILNNLKTYEESGLEGTEKMGVKKELNGNITSLKAIFNSPTVGEKKQEKFTINYKTKDIAVKTGDIWNINIARSVITEATSLYNVKLIIPKSLGPKIFVSPTPVLEKEDTPGIITYYFTKEVLIGNGITAAYGKSQVVNFRLKYQLENPGMFYSTYEIALPPDIKNFQQVKYSSLTPEPKKIYLDKEGNTIAQYKLRSKEKLEVEFIGSAKITAKQIDLLQGGKLKELPNSLKSEYTKSQKYWETKDKNVQILAKELFDPSLNVSQNAKKVYDFVVTKFSYNTTVITQNAIGRKGAAKALAEKSPMACMEFSDIFIAITRAMGIPAREINGYAFNNNQPNVPVTISLKSGDLLHSWAQYYDPKLGWVQVDPTWGNTSKIDYFTKLDTNHVAFVIRGKNSESPQPAGMYRYDENEKLVEVGFSEDTGASFDAKLEIKQIFNFNPILWITGFNKYEVKNMGDTFVYNVDGKNLGPNEKTTVYLKNGDDTLEYQDFNGNQKGYRF